MVRTVQSINMTSTIFDNPNLVERVGNDIVNRLASVLGEPKGTVALHEPEFLGKENDYRKLLNKDLINKMNNIFQEELVKYNYE